MAMVMKVAMQGTNKVTTKVSPPSPTCVFFFFFFFSLSILRILMTFLQAGLQHDPCPDARLQLQCDNATQMKTTPQKQQQPQ